MIKQELISMNLSDQPKMCLYCQTYHELAADYPVNAATFNVESEVPRCDLHAQYRCKSCERKIHFNGISWCHDCKRFTCLRCGGHEIKEHEFLVYDYYYLINCTECGEKKKTLDFAEINATHPYQIGDLHPSKVLQVWLPFGSEVPYKPEKKKWGNTRLVNMSRDVEFEPVEEQSGHSKKVWDANAEIWKDVTRQGDVNHLEVIIPQMLEYLDRNGKKVMDVACGEGTFTRKIAEAGFEVTGTDVSNLVDYAIEMETELKQDINYKKIGVHDLKDNYDENSFDQVTCNMAIMDIDNLPLILENIRYILKPGGQFVFSISHPISAWPVSRSIKLPEDSEHNEDKGRMIDNYADEQPMLVHMKEMPAPMLYYPRMISTYVNTLFSFGFQITAISEPVPDDETIRKYPRAMYRDYERVPIFMIFRTVLST